MSVYRARHEEAAAEARILWEIEREMELMEDDGQPVLPVASDSEGEW